MRRVLGVVLAAAVLIAACGDDDGEGAEASRDDATTTTAAEDATTTTAAEEAGGAPTVTVEGFAFAPATIEVAAGSTVSWTNQDTAPHTVTAGTPEATSETFHEAISPGGTAEITFDQAGTFAYYCSVHPGMRGEVVVS